MKVVSQPSCFMRAAQRRAAAMNDHQLMTFAAQVGNGFGKLADDFLVVERRASDFDHELHCNPSFSSKPNIRFMFWTACPAAPFSRLSMHDTNTARLPSGDNENPMSQ